MSGRDRIRLAGTCILLAVTVLVFGSGFWSLGAMIAGTLPKVLAFPAILGLGAAPVTLAWEMYQASMGKKEDEDMDGSRLQPEARLRTDVEERRDA